MSTWIVIVLPVALLQGAAAQVQPLPAILESVSKNVKETRDSLPDFLCSEKVTSTTFESGRQRDQKIVESIYSIRQSREQREILTVDGKPAKKGAKSMLESGIFFSALVSVPVVSGAMWRPASLRRLQE